MPQSTSQRVHFVGSQMKKGDDTPSLYLVKRASFMGLIRIAGNLFECPSSKHLWKIRNGKIIRLTEKEVDNGEKMTPANTKNPDKYLKDILSDLSF